MQEPNPLQGNNFSGEIGLTGPSLLAADKGDHPPPPPIQSLKPISREMINLDEGKEEKNKD